MALTTCKECKKEVSNTAKICPHCGIKDPGVRWWHGVIAVLALGVLGTGAYMYFGDNSTNSDASKEQTLTSEAKACTAEDGECLFNKYWAKAAPGCRKLIEKSSKYDYEWTDGIMTPMFSHYRNDAPQNQITFIGDKVKFTNGFNAKTTMTYHCTFDLKTLKVVNFNIDSGKL